jgi:hypothetical protein
MPLAATEPVRALLSEWQLEFAMNASVVARLRAVLLVVVTLACWAGASAASAMYYYDELGRLVETVAADGSSVLYAYDAVGNIVSVKHDTATTLGVSGFIPASGPSGTTVTIFGSGFNTTATNNTVNFNGVAATVSAATATTLTVTVPAAATTGVISVTNGAASATSATTFAVAASGAPTITSFTPTIGVQNTPVTVTGTNFQSAIATNKVMFGSMIAPVSSSTPTSLATLDPQPASSGKISVTTPFGTATSAADFYSVPNGYNVADVQFTGRIAVGGAALSVVTTATSKIGLVLFDGVGGTVGEYLQLTNATTGGTLSVYRPDGTVLVSVSVANQLVSLPPLPVTGTYTVVVAPSRLLKYRPCAQPSIAS